MTRQVCMSFHGAVSLGKLRYAVDLAIDELHNQIATCPDVYKYADDIENCEREQEYFKKLLARIDRKLGAQL